MTKFLNRRQKNAYVIEELVALQLKLKSYHSPIHYHVFLVLSFP